MDKFLECLDWMKIIIFSFKNNFRMFRKKGMWRKDIFFLLKTYSLMDLGR